MSLLTITDLQKAYISPEGSQTHIIDIPHFEMEEGTQIALRGTSGVGKTTFLNLIAGILGADSGRIIVADEEMTALSESGRDSCVPAISVTSSKPSICSPVTPRWKTSCSA